MRSVGLMAALIVCLSQMARAERPSSPLPLSAAQFNESPEIRSKIPVFIYYVNDLRVTAFSRFYHNLELLVRALAPHPSDSKDTADYLKGIQNLIEVDMNHLNRSVDDGVVSLIKAFCTRSFFNAGLAVFRNSGNPVRIGPDGVQALGSWDYCLPGADLGGSVRKLWRLDFGGPQALQEYVYEPQPLAHPAFFSQALQDIRAVFPEDRYRYILYMRGHGDADHFLAPRLKYALEGISSEVIRSRFLQARPLLAPNGTVPVTPDYLERVDSVLADFCPRGIGPDQPAGLRKDLILEAIAEAGGGDPRQGMFFSMILMDTSFGDLESSGLEELRPLIRPNDYAHLNIRNAGAFYHFGTASSISGFPFQKFVDALAAPRDFDDRLGFFLNRWPVGGM